ncbi:MAG: hypothetical protein QOJ11_289 [Frankiales bacterium]|jgi:hypothetical protein|nr:hypothetical protein [Frankiales bacterium]
MRDLDQLVQAMRDEADALPVVPFLPTVRSGARDLRRRRRATGVGALALTLLTLVGVSELSAGPSQRPPASSAPTSVPGEGIDALTGSVWYLTSWTSSGMTRSPATDSAPTLAFHDPKNAVTVVSGNWTRWGVDVGSHVLTATEGETYTDVMSAPTAAAYNAFIGVLQGRSTWSVTGTQLVVRGRNGDSLMLTSDLSAQPGGQVHVTLQAKHAAGVRSAGSGPVAGEVLLTRMDGSATDGGTVEAQGITLWSVRSGTYAVTAKIKDGVCTPTTVTVVSGQTAELTVSCRDGISSD